MSTWLLLRGLARESGHWGGFPGLLQQRLGPGHEVRTIDLPGCGTRWQEASPTRVAAIARACRAAHAAQGGGTPVVLVALSLGGMVALEWARQAPAEVAGGVLINTSLRGVSPFWHRLRPANYPRLLSLLRPGVDALARERAILSMTSAQPQRQAQAPSCWAALARERPLSPGNAVRQLLAAVRFTAAPHPPPAPWLLLCSAGDRLVSPRCSHQLATRWRLPLLEHPWAGHDLPLDDPDWLLERLTAWAEDLPAAS
ncbi:alpha/beta fold hydrolase [Ramlibacter tataouinensis]|uniref:AB hydrolase-1 domain-containing protein n=1 Tax=Ramlibacter tataouinensis (strain ATCC BAA-407 / DSM 14655 / LMG 21543 / TTB310) TaxID=365046 RepID=F5Y162_RAMTT|nr:alpha/beta hydrolase [Ramlibacter tataouinensis]AEG93463.1 Conserved hypothetical protein [Ramlibacter tataouinensis TTB310]